MSEQNAALLSAYGGRAKNLPQTLTLDHVSPATRLLEKRRQMFEVQEALDAQKEEFARREDAFRRREEALRKKDLELQESLIKFNKFLQENESKRNRAVKRKQDEHRQRLQKEGEIEKLKEQHRQKLEEEKSMRKQLELNDKYQKYLQDVVDKGSDDYHEIQDLLNRYNTLKTANKDLADTQAKAEQENETKSVEYTHYKKERGNEILNSNNDIANLQHRLEKKEMDVILLMNDLDSTITGGSKQTLVLGQVLRSVQNLLDRFDSHLRASGKPVKRPERMIGKTVEEMKEDAKVAAQQLEEICTYMIDYGSIVDEYAELQKQKAKAEREGTRWPNDE
jgi:chromosome segregation ATPase